MLYVVVDIFAGSFLLFVWCLSTSKSKRDNRRAIGGGGVTGLWRDLIIFLLSMTSPRFFMKSAENNPADDNPVFIPVTDTKSNSSMQVVQSVPILESWNGPGTQPVPCAKRLSRGNMIDTSAFEIGVRAGACYRWRDRSRRD